MFCTCPRVMDSARIVSPCPMAGEPVTTPSNDAPPKYVLLGPTNSQIARILTRVDAEWTSS